MPEGVGFSRVRYLHSRCTLSVIDSAVGDGFSGRTRHAPRSCGHDTEAEKVRGANSRSASRRMAGSRSLSEGRTGFLVIPQVLRHHKRVLIDTGVWIYHFEQHPEFARAAGIAIQSLEDGRFRGIASELALLELTVRPLQLGRQDVADEYELLLSYFPNLELEPVSKEVLLGAAALRARHRLRTPESILLATGIRSGATAAITNDNGWKAAQGLGIEIILLSQFVS